MYKAIVSTSTLSMKRSLSRKTFLKNITISNQKYFTTLFDNNDNNNSHNVKQQKMNLTTNNDKYSYNVVRTRNVTANNLTNFLFNPYQFSKLNNQQSHYFSTTTKNDDDKPEEDVIEAPPPPSDELSALPSNLILDVEGKEDIIPEEEPEVWDEEIKTVQITPFAEPDNVVDEIVLDNEIFGLPVRVDILQRVVQWQLAKKRKGLAKTKDRGEVRGGGKKPWKQKGTGRARAGSIRAPHWRGGGRIHGPRGNRDWSYKLNKKVRRLGVKTALSTKYLETKFAMVENLKFTSHKTKVAHDILSKRDWLDDQKLLFIYGNEEDVDYASLALGNMPQVQMLPSRGANVYSILYADMIIVTKAGLDGLTERLIKEKKPNAVFLNVKKGHEDNSKFKESEARKGKSVRNRYEGTRGWLAQELRKEKVNEEGEKSFQKEI
jgi:large subunit ribosomal protein L4